MTHPSVSFVPKRMSSVGGVAAALSSDKPSSKTWMNDGRNSRLLAPEGAFGCNSVSFGHKSALAFDRSTPCTTPRLDLDATNSGRLAPKHTRRAREDESSFK